MINTTNPLLFFNAQIIHLHTHYSAFMLQNNYRDFN